MNLGVLERACKTTEGALGRRQDQQKSPTLYTVTYIYLYDLGVWDGKKSDFEIYSTGDDLSAKLSKLKIKICEKKSEINNQLRQLHRIDQELVGSAYDWMSQIYNLKIAIHNCIEHRSATHNLESKIFKFSQQPNSELWKSVARIRDNVSLAIGRTRPGLDLLTEKERKEADLKSVNPVVKIKEL